VIAVRKGLSLHIGVDDVDVDHYRGWTDACWYAESDARDMRAIADALGYDTTLLVARHATHDAVSRAIGAVAQALDPGDVFLLTYAGCGGRLPRSASTPPDATSGHATWSLFDRQLLEGELLALLGAVDAGVRIVVVADTSHAGSLARAYRSLGDAPDLVDAPLRLRAVPPGVAEDTFAAHRALYEDAQSVGRGSDGTIGAGVVVLRACQDNQLAVEGARNGLFTAALLAVWRDGRFRGGYADFHRTVQRTMPPWQSPAYVVCGTPGATCATQRPFAI
jgi:hypothetical protein